MPADILYTGIALLISIIGIVLIILSACWVNKKFDAKHHILCCIYTVCCIFGIIIWFWIPICAAFCMLCDAGWRVS